MPTHRFPLFPRLATAALLLSGVLTRHAIAAPPAAAILYVDQAAAGTGTGSSWTNAYPDLHDALAEAATIASPTTPVEIRVAQGLYQPDRGTGDRLGMYRVPAYTELYGGFAGTEVVRSQRDWHAHATILDGDLLGNDAPDFIPTSDCCSEHAGSGCDDAACTAKVVALDDDCTNPFYNYWATDCVDYAMQQCCDICRPSRCDNTYRIIDVLNGDGVVIDGFTIQNGEASNYQIAGPFGSGVPTGGAGLFVTEGAIAVRNLVFVGNAASGSSAARFRNGPAEIEFCTITGNHSFDGNGSAMYVASTFGSSIIRNSLFSKNQGKSLVLNDSVEVRRCRFEGGKSCSQAITASSSLSATPLIADCLFIGHNVGELTTVRSSGWSFAIVNCLFLNNTGDQAPALRISDGGLVVNCAFLGNHATEGTSIVSLGGIFSGSSVINSHFLNNRVASGGALAGSPLNIYNSIFWGNRDDDPNTPIQHEQIKPSSGSQNINYSIVEGWDGSLGGIGNSGLDPLFVDPLGPDLLPATGDENYRLSFDSPAIDEGHPNPPLLAVRDLDGHHRTLCAATDLGPYEFGIADLDCDGDTDLADYFALPACLTGPTIPSLIRRTYFPSMQSPKSRPDSTAKTPPLEGFIGALRAELTAKAASSPTLAAPIGSPLPASCHPFDFDADDAIDLSDVALLMNSFSGP